MVALLNGEPDGTTAQDLYLREGEKTMGVWLPLAMASLQQWMIAIVRMFGDKQTRSHIPMPSTADLLRQWQLPMMASVIASADRDAREREKFEALKRLSEKANNGKQVNT